MTRRPREWVVSLTGTSGCTCSGHRPGNKPDGQPSPDSSCWLAVSFEDAATLAAQRITLQDGKTIDLKLPAGVETGTQMKLSGKGQPGPGGAGDAIVTIEVRNHRYFVRDGDNVRLDLPVSLREAVLGGPVRVPTVEGAVMLNIPKGSSSGGTDSSGRSGGMAPRPLIAARNWYT